MKHQTSLEFLIITSAIGLLLLFAVTQYGSIVKQYKPEPNISLNNYSIPESPVYYQRPYLRAQIPSVSSPGYPNVLSISAYGCSNGTIFVFINSTKAAFFASSITQNFYNVWTYSDNFTPSAGLNAVQISYEISCGGSIYNGSEELSTISTQANPQSTYSTYISERNESTLYSSQSYPIQAIGNFSHCTSENFFYAILPMQYQCGTEDGWDYRTQSTLCSSDGGPQTETTCIVPSSSEYNLSASPSPIAYSYRINLTLVAAVTLRSKISSSNRTDQVYYSGQSVGNASVENVTSPPGSANVAIVYGSRIVYVSYSYVSGYQQAKNNLYGFLSYYNDTTISGDIASQAQQEISTYNYYATQLISASSNATQNSCALEGNYTACPSQYPFYYVINVTIPSRYAYQNQTLSYEGSLIRVSN